MSAGSGQKIGTGALPARSADSVPVRGRPRDAETDEKILAAARTLLATNGFEGMSFEAIAQMTGLTRPTIYRRWPSKVHLANEIANGGDSHLPDVLEQEGLRSQMRAFVDRLMHQFKRPEMPAANAGLAVSYLRSPELRVELNDPIERRARAEFAAVIDHAQALGLVRPGVEVDPLFEILVGAVIFRTIFSSIPSGEERFIEAVCDIVIDGIAKC